MELDHEVDALLERYLGLLDRYTELRAELSSLQTAVFQNIARANFAAERGLRFGADFYDDRMQASRGVGITSIGEEVAAATTTTTVSFTVVKIGDEAASGAVDEDENRKEDGEGGEEEEQKAQEAEDRDRGQKQNRMLPADPLRWFGLLTPMALRQAQSQSIQAVEEVIPKLASLSAEMADVEIQVRRARKKRAKAVAAAGDNKVDDERVTTRPEITA